MNIAIVGYGRMGRTIERIAIERGHKIEAVIDVDNQEELSMLADQKIDVAIEFTQPHTAFDNITALLEQGIPVVSGTTGWTDRMADMELQVKQLNAGFFYAPNYSIGVNLFFEISEYAAGLMNRFPEFDVHIEEIHHIQKLDSPSGTAIHLAEKILAQSDRKSSWVNEKSSENNVLEILSDRQPDVPGIHSSVFTGPHDTIEIKHTASSRLGFATGAILAAEFLKGKKGVYNMKDLLKIDNTLH